MNDSQMIIYHLHSHLSLLDSCTKFEDYVDIAVERGQKAIASTEHGLPRGWVKKKMYCDEKGIKFIHGVEIYLTETHETKVRDNYHTILLARNHEGVRELNRLVSLSSKEDHFYYVNRISFEEFLKISDNIISTSACLASPLNRLDEDHPMFEKLVKKYTFLEVQPHLIDNQIKFNKKLLELSKKYNKKLIAGTDTHSSTKYKSECRDILLRANHKIYDDNSESEMDLTYQSFDSLCEWFSFQGVLSRDEYLEAIQNTMLLDDMCDNFELDTSIKYPILYGSEEEDEKRFEKLCWDRLEDKVASGIIPDTQYESFKSAIKEELRVFSKIGMSGFMLSMSEIMTWCKENGMAIGTARGSVGGSRAAYVTDIIDLNPEQWNTVFSRFANEDRKEIGD